MSRHPGWTRRAAVRALVGAGVAAPAASLVRPRSITGPSGVGGTIGPERGWAELVSRLDPVVVIDGTDVRALAMRALDAAKAIGASYADVRLTRRLRQILSLDRVFRPPQKGSAWYLRLDGEHERLGVGVRVRVGGGWGFAASPYWDPEDVVTLAREAAAEAKANAAKGGLVTAWAPIPIASGHWATPIRVDPLVLPLEEKADLLGGWLDMAYRQGRSVIGALAEADFTREERAVATSEGSYFTQTLYTAEGQYGISRTTLQGRQLLRSATALGLERTAAGWELFTEADLPGQLPRLFEEADPLRSGSPTLLGVPITAITGDMSGGKKPGDVGRYDVVFDAQTMGALLERTLGPATQLDRALGLEANAGGTSYLGPDPLTLLGSFQAASPLVTVTANRSMPRGMATVKWDDEGVVPEDRPLVKDGVLVDYQTTRDQAPLLAPYYQQAGKPVRSHGCAGAESALGITLQQMPNLVLEPGKAAAVGFAELVADTKKGLAVTGAEVQTDFQGRTGWGEGTLREIVDGKLGRVVEGLGFTFSTTNLWKSVVALGGAQSAIQYAVRAPKGEPEQETAYSVRAVPAKLTNVDFVTPR